MVLGLLHEAEEDRLLNEELENEVEYEHDGAQMDDLDVTMDHAAAAGSHWTSAPESAAAARASDSSSPARL